MKRFRSMAVIVGFTLLFALLASACADDNMDNKGGNASIESPAAGGSAADNQEASEKTVVDDAGHQVVVPADPQRIIAPYLEDPLVVLGEKPVAQVLYGNLEQNYLKEELSDVEIIDTTGGGLPLEKLLELSPDLIILGKGMAEEGAYKQYAKIAPTFVVDNVNKNWRETLLQLGELLGKKQIAEEKLAMYDQKIQQTKEHLRQTIGEKEAAIIVLSDKEFYTMGHVQGGGLLFDELGVRPHPLTPAQEEWSALSLEKLGELDADYIFVIKTERYLISDLEGNSLWTGLPAVRQGQVFEVESGTWQYSGLICNERKLADIMKAMPDQENKSAL
ncbi:ABC transporter substrate-binding protein [Cohnella hongkongensis]|uniref:ABC transporter substrate-binding protein n=1 Tax=Cohnella hongkongensis TaxID=178337 RepID=A0ABV9FMV1_9BACL